MDGIIKPNKVHQQQRACIQALYTILVFFFCLIFPGHRNVAPSVALCFGRSNMRRSESVVQASVFGPFYISLSFLSRQRTSWFSRISIQSSQLSYPFLFFFFAQGVAQKTLLFSLPVLKTSFLRSFFLLRRVVEPPCGRTEGVMCGIGCVASA